MELPVGSVALRVAILCKEKDLVILCLLKPQQLRCRALS